MNPSGCDQFMKLLQKAVAEGSLVKLTLGKPDGRDPTLKNLFVRPVMLKTGPRLAFVWRYATRDVTKNYDSEEALRLIGPLVGADFLDAHLFTTSGSAQLETGGGAPRLRVVKAAVSSTKPSTNDRAKVHPVESSALWLVALGVTDSGGRPKAAMADKFRQIQKFGEILESLLKQSKLPSDRPLHIYDMGCGKGYLTFAASDLLGKRAVVHGVEARADLVNFCNTTAAEQGMSDRLIFTEGSIAQTEAGNADILIALHACDTATDDALFKGVTAGAGLIVVAPCCQKEVRPQIVAPPVLHSALRHGIFVERQSEFVTDALRAQLLEWAGYSVKVMEFISTEHTAKNTMIAAVKTNKRGDESVARSIREFAAFYGVKTQALAGHLGFHLQ